MYNKQKYMVQLGNKVICIISANFRDSTLFIRLSSLHEPIS